MSTHRVTTKAQLMLEIEDAWHIINQAIDSLSKAQMTTLRDDEGWTVKDHIAHMTAWERSALYFLQGKPRHEGLGPQQKHNQPLYHPGHNCFVGNSRPLR